jgi:CCR4-NOT transcriptional regulation complex NOT5 subunit
MTQTPDAEKLRFLLPHWIEHNLEHANEFRTWASKEDVARKELLIAAQYLEKASRKLEAGLEKLGGPLEETP